MKLIFNPRPVPLVDRGNGGLTYDAILKLESPSFPDESATPRRKLADSILRIQLTNFIVQIPLCNPTTRISSWRCYCVCSSKYIPLFPSSAFYQRHPIVRMRILARGFYRAVSIVRISSCGFHSAVPSWRLSCGIHCPDSILKIILRISWCAFHHLHCIMCIPSCAFHRVHCIVR